MMRRRKKLRANGRKLARCLIDDFVGRTGCTRNDAAKLVNDTAVMETYWKDPLFIMHYDIEYLVDEIMEEYGL